MLLYDLKKGSYFQTYTMYILKNNFNTHLNDGITMHLLYEQQC